MMSSKLKWLIVIQLLLNEQALCRLPPPLAPTSSLLPEPGEEPDLSTQLLQAEKPAPDRVRSAAHIVSELRSRLQGQIQDRFHIPGNVTCEDLLSASSVDDPASSVFPQELLGLSLVPVLVVAGCVQEAQTLVLKLYNLLGAADTEELLLEVEALIERRMNRAASTPTPAPAPEERHMEAVMFNIQQLATPGDAILKQEVHCEGWSRVSGTTLVGKAVKTGPTGGLEEAVSACERLGALCAGVTSGGRRRPGKYQAVFKKGSRILPSEATENECWIQRCSGEAEEEVEEVAGNTRVRRSLQRSCIDKREERVYNVVEWIPAVSTLYNLGTAVYYASLNCSATAKERAILSAVDLGTDALMVATGGTVGVAGYALGAGVKTGVKAGVRYLLNSLKQEDDDLLVNQFSWEDDTIRLSD